MGSFSDKESFSFCLLPHRIYYLSVIYRVIASSMATILANLS